MQQDFKLEGKVVLVTGASSGFGRAIAIAVAEAGATVILTARDKERLEETKLLMSGQDHKIILCDLSEAKALDELVNQIPKLDGVVLCAGIQKIAPARFVTEDLIDTVLQINTKSSILLTQRLLRKNLITRGSSVVFISSIAATYATVGNSIYAASKGALNSFARCLATEVAPLHIRVNCVLPGTVRTGATDANMVSEEDRAHEEMAYPLGKGSVEDIANGVVYLLAPASRWVTGLLLTVDGGLTLN